jgi:hypothetical protein
MAGYFPVVSELVMWMLMALAYIIFICWPISWFASKETTSKAMKIGTLYVLPPIAVLTTWAGAATML